MADFRNNDDGEGGGSRKERSGRQLLWIGERQIGDHADADDVNASSAVALPACKDQVAHMVAIHHLKPFRCSLPFLQRSKDRLVEKLAIVR